MNSSEHRRFDITFTQSLRDKYYQFSGAENMSKEWNRAIQSQNNNNSGDFLTINGEQGVGAAGIVLKDHFTRWTSTTSINSLKHHGNPESNCHLDHSWGIFIIKDAESK